METLAPTPPERFNAIIDGLYDDIRIKLAKRWVHMPLDIPLISLIWRRLRRLRRRFVAIMAQHEAGTLPPLAPPPEATTAPSSLAAAPPPQAAAAPTSPAEAAPSQAAAAPSGLAAADSPATGAPNDPAAAPPAATSPSPRPPAPWRRNGWVIYAVSWFVNARRYELEDMLADPQTAELLARAPQLGSVLRPMCHMLAVKPPTWLRRPRRPRPPAPKFPPAPEFLLNAPGAILHPDGSVWMHMGSSTHWKPGCGLSLEEARKFDPPRRLWPR